MSHKSEDTDNHKTDISVIPSDRWGEEVSGDISRVERNLLEIKEKIAPYKPRIIGVTKYFGTDAIVNGYRTGIRDFGESRVVESIEKIKSLPTEVRNNSTFHFIGHLQTNKVEKAVEYFDCIHSIDSLKLAKVVSEAACNLNKREKVLLQVNIANEIQKFGFNKDSLVEDIEEILSLKGIEVIGLMSMMPFGASEEELRKLFNYMREFRDEVRKRTNYGFEELSMGMSDDYHLAVEYGATMIRIGRKLFK